VHYRGYPRSSRGDDAARAASSQVLDALGGIVRDIGDVDILIAIAQAQAQILAERAAEAQAGKLV